MAIIKFGTDGFRGIIDQDFNDYNVRLAAYAYGIYLQEKNLATRGVVVGFDCRYKSMDFAQNAALVLGNMGLQVYLFSQAVPTPVVSYNILAHKLGGGIVITASHNPSQWNGFKIKTHQGAGAGLEITDRIEELCQKLTLPFLPLSLNELKQKGLVRSADSFKELYYQQLASLVDLDLIKKQTWRICTNPMHGAGIDCLPAILRNGRIKVEEINDEIDDTFGGIPPEPVDKNLASQQNLMKELPYDVGLALDGDADRLGVISEEGRFLTPPQVFSLLAYYMYKHRNLQGGLVRTVNASVMLEKICGYFRKDLYTVPVGFKYIAEHMLNGTADMGGEESGSYGYAMHMPERDGILSGLLLLEFMAKEKKKPQELLNELYQISDQWYYQREDIYFDAERNIDIKDALQKLCPASILGQTVRKLDRTDGLKLTLNDDSWLLLRVSGTEPLIRIYAESLSPVQTAALLSYGKQSLNL